MELATRPLTWRTVTNVPSPFLASRTNSEADARIQCHTEGEVPVRFVDARGTEWEVWEVAARTFADSPAPRMCAGIGGQASWLCFESATQSRRLSHYPARWQAMLPRDLEALCQSARPVRPVLELEALLGGADAW